MALLTGVAILAAAVLLSLPRGAVAQMNDLTADSCISTATSPGYMTFTNNCRETVKFKYCMMNDNRQGCGSAGLFKETVINPGAYMTLNDNRGFYVRWFGCKPGAVFVERPYDPFFDKERRVAFFCSPSAATFAAWKAADEDHEPLHAEVWSVREVSAVTPGGKRTCKVALNHGAFGLDPPGTSFTKTRHAQYGPFELYWRSACDQGGWIEGAGTLGLQSIDEYEGGVVRHVYTGRAVRGRLTGPTSYSRIYGYCEYDDACDPFTPTRDDELGIQLSLTFVDGCNNWKRSAPSKCVAARGLALVGSPPVTPGSPRPPAGPGAPKPPTATAPATASGPRAHPAAEFARPTVSIGSLFSAAGYPEEARRLEQEGQTNYSVTVNGAGLPTRCDITRSSGSASLDARAARS